MFYVVVWLVWLQSLPATSRCSLLIVSHPVSSTSPQPLPPFPFPIYLSNFVPLSLSPWVPLVLFMLPFSSGHFIFHPFPFHSSLNSVNSSDSRGSSGSHSHSPSSSSSSSSSHHLFNHHHARHRYRSSTLPQQTPARLSSISSHDSGFISSSHDQYASSKSSSPMPAETKVRKIPQLSTLDRSLASDCIHMG